MTSSTGGGSMPSAESEEGINTFREMREYARGVLDVDHHDVHPIAGLIDDPETLRVLTFMAENYSPSTDEINAGMPRSFWDTEFAQRAIRKKATATASRAIREGNLTQTAYLSGLPSYKSDISGLHAINKLARWLVASEQCKLIYMAALMGRGKTDLSLTFLEVIHDHYRRLAEHVDEVEIPRPEFAANFYVETPPTVDTEVHEISSERELLEWARGGSSSEVRWFVFDEASTELTAQSGENAQKVAKTMAPFVKKMRKLGINMIVIGHDKGDVHVAIRSLADFVDKTGLKTASFYAGIKKREPTGHLFDVGGIPPTSWDFDTDDMAEWTWLGDEGEEAPEDVGMSDREFEVEVYTRAARLWLELREIGVGQDDIAGAISGGDVSVTPTTISRYAKKMEESKNPELDGAKA